MAFIYGLAIGITFIIITATLSALGDNQKQLLELKEEVKRLNRIIVIMIAQGGKNE